MNIIEKIIAAHSGKTNVAPGDTVEVKHDISICDEAAFPQLLMSLREAGIKKIKHKNTVALINGQQTSERDEATATLVQAMDYFISANEIENFFRVGQSGGCHNILTEQKIIKPGDLITGSHGYVNSYGALCTLSFRIADSVLGQSWSNGTSKVTVPECAKISLQGKLPDLVSAKDLAFYLSTLINMKKMKGSAIEISGSALENLSMPSRFVIVNFLSQFDLSTILFTCDDLCRESVREYAPSLPGKTLFTDPDYSYCQELEVDLNQVVPMVAIPSSPANCIPVSEVGDIPVHQVIIGGCADGDIEQFRQAGRLLEDNDVAPGIKFGIFPSCHRTIREMLDEGLGLMLTGKGGRFAPPSCQACSGSGPKILSGSEVGLFTTNHNEIGTHGTDTSKIYLSGPYVAAASAITGVITDPREL